MIKNVFIIVMDICLDRRICVFICGLFFNLDGIKEKEIRFIEYLLYGWKCIIRFCIFFYLML